MLSELWRCIIVSLQVLVLQLAITRSADGADLVIPRPFTTATWAHQFCGTESLYVFLKESGAKGILLEELENTVSVGPNGVSVEDLLKLSEKYGIQLRAFENADWAFISVAKIAILHIEGNHFVTFFSDSEGCRLFDSRTGVWKMTQREFEEIDWKGVAIVRSETVPSSLMLLFVRSTTCWILVAAVLMLVLGMVRDKWNLFGKPVDTLTGIAE